MILFLNNLLLLLTSVLLLLNYVEKILISWNSWCPMILSKTCRNKICLNLISILYSYMLSWWKSVRRITRQNDEHTMTNMLLKETGIQCTMAGSMNARGELTTRKESFTTRSHLLQVSNTQIQMSTKMSISANSRKLTQTNINDIYYMFMCRNN